LPFVFAGFAPRVSLSFLPAVDVRRVLGELRLPMRADMVISSTSM
jgi:hypothetical protein